MGSSLATSCHHRVARTTAMAQLPPGHREALAIISPAVSPRQASVPSTWRYRQTGGHIVSRWFIAHA